MRRRDFESILRPRQFLLEIHDLFDLHQKPAVDLREVEYLLDGEAGAEGVADEEDAFVPQARDQFVPQSGVARQDVAVAIDFSLWEIPWFGRERAKR